MFTVRSYCVNARRTSVERLSHRSSVPHRVALTLPHRVRLRPGWAIHIDPKINGVTYAKG